MRKFAFYILGFLFWVPMAFAGAELGWKGAVVGRVHYIGIGSDTLFTLTEDPVVSPFSCKDVDRVEQHVRKKAKGLDSFRSQHSCRTMKKADLQQMFRNVYLQSQGEDVFVFYFGCYTQKVKTTKGIVTAFFLTFPEVASTGTELEFLDSNNYFTLAELRIWMNSIPARNQVVLIEAGFTHELKSEFTHMLLETNEGISNLENRRRVLLFPQGVGVEDNQLKSGRFTYAMTTGLENHNFNLLDVFDANKSETFEFECWRSYVEANTGGFNAGKGINLIKEWELQSLLPNPGHKTRGENVVIKPRPNASSPKDTLPRFFAFVCGTNQYEHLDPLSNPEFDAETVANTLQDKYGFHAKLLRNPANVGVFMKELKRFTDSVEFRPYDELLVFIAGHGVYHPFSDAGFIAFANSETDLAMSTFLEHRRLVNILDNLPCKKVMLILDVCFGGSLSQGIVSQADPRLCSAASPWVQGTWPYTNGYGNLVYQNLHCANRVYCTSGGYEYVDDGVAGAHSPFASALISALDGNQEEVLFSSDIFGSVKRNMARNPQSISQMPTYGRFGLDNNSTDFVFVRKN